MNSSPPSRRLAAVALVLSIIGAPVAPQSQPPSRSAPQQKPADPGKARKAVQEGQKAERAGDWTAAYAAYQSASSFSPQDADIQLLRDTARFRLVQQRMDAAERSAIAGDLSQSIKELRAALALDSTYSVANERLAQIEALQNVPSRPRGPRLGGPVQIHPQPGLRTFDFRGDVRSAYSEIARQFGLTPEFDPDLPPRLIRFRAPAVDFATAMTMVGAQTHTFWTAIDDGIFIVAEDLPAKRKQYEQIDVRTFILPASLSDAEMTETLRLIRTMTGSTRASLNTATRELTIRDTPQVSSVAEQLLNEIEQGRGELVLEFELLEVDRDAARLLGITPPTSARASSLSRQDLLDVQNAATSQQLLAVIQRIFGTTSGGGLLGGLLPPLVAFGGGLTTFFSTPPGMQADFSQTLGTVRSAQRLLLRAQDGQAATFFQGTHFPIALSLLSSDLANAQIAQGALPRSDLLAGKAPSAVVTGSLRGNGKLDLIVANKTDNSISVFLGNGDGTFAARVDSPVGTAPVALALADFNGDSKLDLAVVNQGDNTVSIFFGNGDGTFTATQVLPTGQSPAAIVAADFNSDTRPDLAVVNHTDNTVSIFMNNGVGVFAAAPSLVTGAAPQALAAAELNTDGKTDLAVVNFTDNTVSIFLGNGDGTFSTKTDFPTAAQPTGIAAGDFDNNGRRDLAVTNFTGGTVSIFMGNGDGTFSSRVDFTTGTAPQAIITGDFNGDGIPDLITANQSANTASVLIGDGLGGFNFRLDVPVGASPVALATGDFNGDTRPDLAVAAQTGNIISIILNTSTINIPNVANQTSYPASQYEDIGLKVKATPHLHPNSEVTLELTFEIKSLSGSSINNIPIISNRTIQQTVRVRENEITILSGMVDQQDLRSILGWPGIGQIPAVGALAAPRNTTTSETELLIVITPRMLRPVGSSGRPIFAGKDTSGRGANPQQ